MGVGGGGCKAVVNGSLRILRKSYSFTEPLSVPSGTASGGPLLSVLGFADSLLPQPSIFPKPHTVYFLTDFSITTF